MIIAMDAADTYVVLYICLTVVVTALIICGSRVLMKWGPPERGSVLSAFDDPPQWSSETKTTITTTRTPEDEATGEEK